MNNLEEATLDELCEEIANRHVGTVILLYRAGRKKATEEMAGYLRGPPTLLRGLLDLWLERVKNKQRKQRRDNGEYD